jgi:hypothetical protein
MAFATAVGLLRPQNPWLNITTAVAICIVLVAIAGPLDGLKTILRSALHALIPYATTPGGAGTHPAPHRSVADISAS